MSEGPRAAGNQAASVDDVGAYCRLVEDHLTRANGGHLVRIVGPGFELVRQWADEGIPLSVVYRAIEMRVERHEAGHARRPLRIEFCAADVREVYDAWRRAVGLTAQQPPASDGGGPEAEPAAERRRPSLSKHLDRAIERLSRVAGRLDLPGTLRDGLDEWLQELTALREAARSARGPARDEIAAKLAPLDRAMLAGARAAASPALLGEILSDAERDLAPFRGRLAGAGWQQAVDATVDRLLRDRFGLPTMGSEGFSEKTTSGVISSEDRSTK